MVKAKKTATTFLGLLISLYCFQAQAKSEDEILEPDQACIEYCVAYEDKCSVSNPFEESSDTRGFIDRRLPPTAGRRNLIVTDKKEDYPRRHLIAGGEGLPNRGYQSGSKDDGDSFYDECIEACMQYPRPKNPTRYEAADFFGPSLAGDTYWCRALVLSYISNIETAAEYCPYSGPTGGFLCSDVLLDDYYTPYELYRAGLSTRRAYAYCDLLLEDEIADCTSSGINDENIEEALALIPPTVKLIFLNDNKGITKLKRGTFKALQCPECIVSLYVEDCQIDNIAFDSLHPMINLEVFQMNNNPTPELHPRMFEANIMLRQFNYYNSFTTGYEGVSEVPEALFTTTKNLERLVLNGHFNLEGISENLLTGLTKLEVLNLNGNGLKGRQLKAGVFDSLISLKYLGLDANNLRGIPARFFASGWSQNLLVFAYSDNNVKERLVKEEDFAQMPKLERVYFHGNEAFTDLPPGIFINNHNLISFTLGSEITAQTPN